MFCPYCGAYNENNAAACAVCGRMLNVSAGRPTGRKPNTARTPEKPAPPAQNQGFFNPQANNEPFHMPQYPPARGSGAQQSPDAPAAANPAEEHKPAAEPKKRSPLVPVLIAVLVLLVLIGAWLVIISSGNFGDGWFTRAEAKQNESVSVLDAAEKVVFNTESYDFRCNLDGGDASGTVEWGEDLMHSRIVIETADQVIYLNNGKLLIAEDNAVSGVDLNNMFDVLSDGAGTILGGLDLFSDLGLSDLYEADWIDALKDASAELKDLPELLVQDNRINQEYVTKLFDRLFSGFVTNRVDAKTNDSKDDDTGTEPNFTWAIGMVVDFLMNHMSESAAGVTQEGSGNNITYTFRVDMPALTDEFIDYLSSTELAKSVCGLFGITSDELIDKLELENLLEDFKSTFTEPIEMRTEIKKGLLTGCTVTANGETVMDLGISGCGKASVNAENYAYIEDMLNDPTVENNFISDVRSYVFGELWDALF